MKFEAPKVAFAEADKLPWLLLKDTPGFGGVDIPGITCKFFGREGVGPWFYLVKHEPGVRVERHSHEGDVFHYILEGEWLIGKTRKFGPGFMQYEHKGLNYGPITSGPQGSLFLAIYDRAPNFIPAPRGEKDAVPDSDYEARAA
jgi:ChrR-like protein with cupin domain